MRNRLRRAFALAAFALAASTPDRSEAATYTVTNTADGGAGSLRQAILDANASPGSDEIAFDIPGAGPHAIVALTALPTIIEPVLIDGYSQPGSAWNTDPLGDNAVIQIELVGNGTDGLTITGGSSIVQGLALHGFQTALVIATVEGNTIQGNFIGLGATGEASLGNAYGVIVTSPFGADRVGDANPAARNVISGNVVGVSIQGTGGKSILGNLIGTDLSGTAAIPNTAAIELTGCSFCVVGGSPPARNVISGSFTDAVTLTDGTFNAVRYNTIGLDATGTVDLGNAGNGIRTAGTEQSYLIDHNVISGNGENGILLTDASFPEFTNSELIQSNRIGTAADGFSPAGNDGAGVRIQSLGDLRILDNIVAYNRVGIWQPLPSIYSPWEIVNASMFGNRGGLGISHAFTETIAPNVPDGPFNFPIITSVAPDAGGTRVQGYLDGHPDDPVTIELYRLPSCSVVRPRDFLEGRTSFGTISGMTDLGGYFAFDQVFPVTLDGETVTATSTIVQTAPLNGFFGPTRHTSSFSQRLPFSISPASGPAAGGTTVTISGTNFDPAATVMFAGQPAGTVIVDSYQQITATTPALTPGVAWNVEVANPGAAPSPLPLAWVSDFLDVPPSNLFHDSVVALASNGITGGVGGGNYGVSLAVLRQQMAVFLLKAKHGICYVPPPCAQTFADVPCPSLFADWIEALAAEGITGGCGGGNYCPGNPVTRAQMSAFLLKGKFGSSHVPPPCTQVFNDVACPGHPFADWIGELVSLNITAGCGGGNYCPANPNTRGQMAVFLVSVFGLP
jgi:hypothetical protein